MFCSPLSTKQERAGVDKDNPLAGNIFANKNASLSYFGYKSLLETLALYPKKKHFKKVLEHLLRFEDKDQVSKDIVELIIRIGIQENYPVLLGKTVKHFLENGYMVPKKVF